MSTEGYDMLVSPEVAAARGVPLGMGQGHRCFGGCCDMRRAVIIVNLVSLLLATIDVIYFAMESSFLSHNKIFQDDDVEREIESEMHLAEHVMILALIFTIPFNGAGVYGAMKFKIWPVAVSLSLYALRFVVLFFSWNPGCLLPFFFAYPHVFFIKEVKEGIMSEANYPLEKVRMVFFVPAVIPIISHCTMLISFHLTRPCIFISTIHSLVLVLLRVVRGILGCFPRVGQGLWES